MAIVVVEEMLAGSDEVKMALDQAITILTDLIEDADPAMVPHLPEVLDRTFLQPLTAQSAADSAHTRQSPHAKNLDAARNADNPVSLLFQADRVIRCVERGGLTSARRPWEYPYPYGRSRLVWYALLSMGAFSARSPLLPQSAVALCASARRYRRGVTEKGSGMWRTYSVDAHQALLTTDVVPQGTACLRCPYCGPSRSDGATRP